MAPNLWRHDFILVNKFEYGLRFPFSNFWIWKFRNPRRGEIIVFRSRIENDKFFVKRVLATTGDTVEADLDGRLLVNGLVLTQPCEEKSLRIYQDWIAQQPFKNVDHFNCYQESHNENLWTVVYENGRMRFEQGKKKLNFNESWVQGDNRDNSVDSRNWGSINNQDILGKVERVAFHYDFENSAKNDFLARFFVKIGVKN